MALYFDLPVYKKTYDLLLDLLDLSSNLTKAYKYTLGERIQLEAIEVILNIYKANACIEKLQFISKSREHIEIIRLMIRILYDTKQISLKRMIFINKIIEEIFIEIQGFTETVGFEQWKAEIDITTGNEKSNGSQQVETCSEHVILSLPAVSEVESVEIRTIIRQIKEYPIISKTPVEAFSFLAELQKLTE